MTAVIFGPFCTQALADMGADVIKIEPPTGDNGRTIGSPARTRGMGKLHMTINRGKRSVSWDLKTEEGRAKLRKLIATSDVFIHNVRADAIRRLGFDYESVRAFAPEIIYVHCCGLKTRLRLRIRSRLRARNHLRALLRLRSGGTGCRLARLRRHRSRRFGHRFAPPARGRLACAAISAARARR
jgi:hypothetical protein